MSDTKLTSSKEAESKTPESIEKLPTIEEVDPAEPPTAESYDTEAGKQVEEIVVEKLVLEEQIVEEKDKLELEGIEAAEKETAGKDTGKFELASEIIAEVSKDIEKSPSFEEVYVDEKGTEEEETVNAEDEAKTAPPADESKKPEETPKAPHVWWKKKPPPPKLPCEILTPNDSRDPSYTNMKLPYSVICRQRYQKCARMYRKQFITEIKRQEEMQFRALDGIRIRREFCNPIIEQLPREERIRLTYKQQRRLDDLLNAE